VLSARLLGEKHLAFLFFEGKSCLVARNSLPASSTVIGQIAPGTNPLDSKICAAFCLDVSGLEKASNDSMLAD
jgi:hypothetical protein